MTYMRARLERIERRMGGFYGPGKLVVVRTGGDRSGVDEVLTANGIDRNNPAHLIIAVLSRAGPDDSDRSRPAAELVFIKDR